MPRKTLIAGILVAVAIVSGFVATCDRAAGWAPPADPAGPTAQSPPATPARTPRKRAGTSAVPAELPSPGPSNKESEDEWESNRSVVLPLPSAGNAPKAAEPPATGRVRTLMLKDGQPFEGGHVCFYPADKYVEARPWDGMVYGDRAHLGLPVYTTFWPNFDPVLGSGDGAQQFEERARGVTGRDGVVTLSLPADRSLVPYVRYTSSGIPLVSQPRVSVAVGGTAEITIEAASMRTVSGRCVDARGNALAGIWVQAIAPREERPLSRKAETSPTGAFQLQVFGSDPDVRVRAVVPYVAHPLGIYDSESEVPPIPAETTVAGVVPSEWPFELRMPDAPLIFVDLSIAEGESPLTHLQIESLVFDPAAAAWGRLGGPRFQRADGKPGGRRVVVALPRAEAMRPLMLWSKGWAITAVDPRGADRVSVEVLRGRRASVRGTGWMEGDRLRVVCVCGPPGDEIPCVWIECPVGKENHWARDDAPVGAIEFQILRDGVVVGRTRVPPRAGPVGEVSLDVR